MSGGFHYTADGSVRHPLADCERVGCITDVPAPPPRVWLIGESNPYGPEPEYALYSEPPESAGGRLRRLILGMGERDYLRSFERRNLLSRDRWSVPAAREAARVLRYELGQGDAVVLFGAKVSAAWFSSSDRPWAPFALTDYGHATGPTRVLELPHPSGLSRAWNAPGAFLRARECVAQLAPHLRPLLGRPLEEIR